jgi:pilus assembly protein CpaB
MRTNTIITLVASAGFGLLAVFLARGWIDNAIENEFRKVKAPLLEKSVPDFKTVPVLVADVDLAFGDGLAREAVKLVNYPEDAVPAGAFTSFDNVFDGNGERFVLTELAYNEPILETKITGPNAKASLSAKIRPGYRAVSVRVDDVSGVAGFVVPGDIVDIIYTREPETAANQRQSNGGAASAYISDVILQNITVLGVDQNQSESTASADVARTVTLEVTNEEGQVLNLAMEYGALSLSLRSMGETDPTVVRQVKLSDLGPRKPRTYSKNTKPKPVAMAPKKRRFADVTVIRDGLQDAAKVERLTVKRDVTRTDRTAEEAKLLLSELAGGE